MGTQINDTAVGLQIGGTASEKVGFFGATPADQPASANQAAVTFETVGNVQTNNSATVQITNNFSTIITLVNQIRTDLVELGLQKGSA